MILGTFAELAKLAHALLRREWDAKKRYLRWNTLHILPAEDYVSCCDTNLTGTMINLIVGGDDRIRLGRRYKTASYVRNG